METVLMHTCCAPCSLSCIEPLRSEGIEPVAFWYNPNIHPWKEYEARRDCLLGYAPSIGMEVRVREEYGLRPFVEAVAGDLDHRCGYCYTHRLEETARYAAQHGFSAFTTTLLASVYQRHDIIAFFVFYYLPELPVRIFNARLKICFLQYFAVFIKLQNSRLGNGAYAD